MRIKQVCVLLFLSSTCLAQMTHQEEVVRNAYARLSFALEQGTISQLAMEATGIPTPKELASISTEQRVSNSQLSITLSNFVIGSAADILTRNILELIDPATQYRLAISGGRHSFISSGRESQWYEPRASWQPADPLPPETAGLTFRDFLGLQWHEKQPDSVWQTYASFSVTVNYQGKVVGPYKALFMFGQSSGGEQVVEPEDGIIDATAIAAAMHEHLFADCFVNSTLRDIPVVRKWVTTTEQASGGKCFEEQGVCCDALRVRCGPARADVDKARSLELPSGPPSQNGEVR